MTVSGDLQQDLRQISNLYVLPHEVIVDTVKGPECDRCMRPDFRCGANLAFYCHIWFIADILLIPILYFFRSYCIKTHLFAELIRLAAPRRRVP